MREPLNQWAHYDCQCRKAPPQTTRRSRQLSQQGIRTLHIHCVHVDDLRLNAPKRVTYSLSIWPDSRQSHRCSCMEYKSEWKSPKKNNCQLHTCRLSLIASFSGSAPYPTPYPPPQHSTCAASPGGRMYTTYRPELHSSKALVEERLKMLHKD